LQHGANHQRRTCTEKAIFQSKRIPEFALLGKSIHGTTHAGGDDKPLPATAGNHGFDGGRTGLIKIQSLEHVMRTGQMPNFAPA